MEVTMVDQADTSDEAKPAEGETKMAVREAALKEKAKELAVFRDAGVLTEAELQELLAMARWHLP